MLWVGAKIMNDGANNHHPSPNVFHLWYLYSLLTSSFCSMNDIAPGRSPIPNDRTLSECWFYPVSVFSGDMWFSIILRSLYSRSSILNEDLDLRMALAGVPALILRSDLVCLISLWILRLCVLVVELRSEWSSAEFIPNRLVLDGKS